MAGGDDWPPIQYDWDQWESVQLNRTRSTGLTESNGSADNALPTMSRNARRKNAKTRSIQTSVQVFLIVAGIGLLVAGLAFAASGTSVHDTVGSLSEEWDDSEGAEPGADSDDEDEDEHSGDDEEGSPNDGDDTDGDDTDGDEGDTPDDGSDDGGADDGDSDDSDGDGDGDGETDGPDDEDGDDERDDEENDDSADAHSLTVLVEDEDGDSIEDATVTVDAADWDNPQSDEATTDDDGEVEFELEDGEYDLTVSADGYEDVEHDVEIDGGDEDVWLVLEASDDEQDDEGDADGDDDADDTYTLTTYVVDEDGDPIEDATVEVVESGLFGDNDETGTTDDDGEAEFDLEDGEYDLTVSVDGYEDAEDHVEIDGDDEEILVVLQESD